MMLATVNGRFRKFEGMLEIGSGAPRATGVVKAASINTGEPTRRDFGLAWNQVLETGGALLGNKVKLALEISAVKSEAARSTV